MSFIYSLMPSSSLLNTRTSTLVGRSWNVKSTTGIMQLLQNNNNNNNNNNINHNHSLFSLWDSSSGGGIISFLRWKHTLKTNKSVSKRFRVRGGSGHKKSTLTHMRSGVQHNTGYRPRAAINKLGQSKPVANKKVERKMKQCMGVL